jgi:hypothetical protein
MKIAKKKAGSYAASRKIKDWALLRGRPPLIWGKIVHRGGARNVEAPAFPSLRTELRGLYQEAAWVERPYGGSGYNWLENNRPKRRST